MKSENNLLKVLVVCQHFYPENFRINDECFELAKRGHNITVLTGLPNYPKGKIYPEYKHRKNRRQVINNVTIERSFLVGRGSSLFMMALNYLSFTVLGSFKALSLKDDFDVVYAYQLSPVTMTWPGIAVKWKQKIPLVIHCLDQWPISLTTGPIERGSAIYEIMKKISKWTYDQADLITISSKSFKKYFEKEHNITESKKGLIYRPSYAESVYENVGYEENDYFDLMFAGNIGPAQSCETIIECANLLKQYETIRFHFVGDGLSCQNCKDLAKEYGLDNVFFHGFHNIDDMADYYRMADALLITMQDNEVVNSTLPAKIQSYMLAGKPIFGAISGEVKNTVKEADCGACVSSGDYAGLAEIILENYQNKDALRLWGNNGYKYYKENFEKEVCLDQIEDSLKEASRKRLNEDNKKQKFLRRNTRIWKKLQ